jgi:hypothetical protein
MAYAGQILENPVSGERIVFRKTASDTNGELLAFELFLAPDGHVPGAHVHPQQEERFEVVKGTMKFRKGLKTVFARAGDTVDRTTGSSAPVRECRGGAGPRARGGAAGPPDGTAARDRDRAGAGGAHKPQGLAKAS